MELSPNQPEIEPPPEELNVARAVDDAETLEECLDEMELCDHAVDSPPGRTITGGKYEFPLPITYPLTSPLLYFYSAIRKTSTTVLTHLRETITKGYEFKLPKACFKEPEIVKELLHRIPEGGDGASKTSYAFLQEIKNYLSIRELVELFRRTNYKPPEPNDDDTSITI